jgi:hypothetical protein
MSCYTHHRHKDTGQYVHVAVLLCHTGDLNSYYTHHKHIDSLQHIRADVHSEVSVAGGKNIKFDENLSVGNPVTQHGKRNESISPF